MEDHGERVHVWPHPSKQRYEAERKVIEAAKAVVADLFPYGDERWDALIRAVEALEKAEVE